MDKDIKPDYVSRVFEPRQTLGDTSKVKSVLGWKPKVDIEEGLKKTVEETINAV
jgi:nucleoside-diphosphate-sugar epimerase